MITITSNKITVTVTGIEYTFYLNLIGKSSLQLPYWGGSVNFEAYVTSVPEGANLSGISIEIINMTDHTSVIKTTGTSGIVYATLSFPDNIYNYPQTYTVEATATGGAIGNTVVKSNPIQVEVQSRIKAPGGGGNGTICTDISNITSQLPPEYFVNSTLPASYIPSVNGKTTVTQSGNNFIINVPYPSNYTLPEYYEGTGVWYSYSNLGNNQTILQFTSPQQIVQNGVIYNLVNAEYFNNPPEYGNPSFVYGNNERFTYESSNGSTLTYFSVITATASVAYASYTIPYYCVPDSSTAIQQLNEYIQGKVAIIIKDLINKGISD